MLVLKFFSFVQALWFVSLVLVEFCACNTEKEPIDYIAYPRYVKTLAKRITKYNE